MGRIFISHASADDSDVTELSHWMMQVGLGDTFVDHLHIPAGTDWNDRLPKALQEADILLLYVTGNWLRSSECYAEYRAFYYAKRPVIPLLIPEALQALSEEEDARFTTLCASAQGLPFSGLPPDPLTRDLLQGSIQLALGQVRRARRSKRVRAIAGFSGALLFVLAGLAISFRTELGAAWDRLQIKQAFTPLSIERRVALIDITATDGVRARGFRECDDPEICPQMVVLPPGAFRFGSRDDAWPEPRETPSRIVEMAPGLAVSVSEITRAHWLTCHISTRLRPGPGCREILPRADQRNHPVTSVSWRDAQGYVAWLNLQLFGTPTGPYRLLSEVEWEYAAWGRTTPEDQPDFFFWGDHPSGACRFANAVNLDMPDALGIAHSGLDCPNNPVQLSPVGTFAANNFGLVDIAGNVAEWVEDCWHDSHENRPAGARAWVSGAEETRCARVIKGGSWMGQSDNLRPGARVRADEEVFGLNIGFRVARDLSWDDAGSR